MCLDSFRSVARDKSVRYMMVPSRLDPSLCLGGSFVNSFVSSVEVGLVRNLVYDDSGR